MLKIIAIYNIKGGVGKTTTAVNLAYEAATCGYRTVLWDLDAQGASTYTLRCKPRIKGGADDMVDGERALRKLAVKTGYENLHLLPADFSYRHMDTLLSEYKKATKRLLKLMRPLRKRYDLLLIDCPPGMTLTAENVVRAADALVVPILPSPFSVNMLDMLVNFIEDKRWTDVSVQPFFSMVDRRKKLHRETVDHLRERHPSILKTQIGYLSEIERMSVRRAPIASYAPRSAAAAEYRHLWAEIQAGC